MSGLPGDKYLTPEQPARVEILEDLSTIVGELAPADEKE